ncbi:MAG: VWA domain-containing protein [Alphaproteobacteria bacterium]|nr:VWA domain-containing protein [Alphaproteobacteria bacterium]
MTVSPALANVPSNGCRLVADDGRELPLRAVEISADAGGGLCRTRLRQRFANPYAEPLSVTYLLPLPADGAVVDLAFVLAGRRVVGQVQRKADARAAFEQALIEGRTATLLEQERSSLFTQELGNVPPGAEVEVEIDVEQPLAWEDGGWTWRWPTVVGPRYLGAPGETPDADRVVVDVGNVEVRCSAHLAIGDDLTGPASSPSHPLTTGETGVTLSGGLDRDLVVRWPVAAPEPGLRLEVARPDGDESGYALLTLVPPRVAGTPVQRDLCLLIDTSGSMGGTPLAQAVAFCTALVGGLRTGDRLEMIEFSNTQRRWKTDPVAIDAASRAQAMAWLGALRASGGTAMHEAVTEALRPQRQDAERQVVLITDGYIGFEAEVIGRIRRGLPRGSRIHTVGIGSSVNRTLTGGVARAGGGHEAIVGPDEPVGTAVSALLTRTGDPLWTEVSLSGAALQDQAPAAIPDLLAGAPARVSLKLSAQGGPLVVTWRSAAGVETRELRVSPPLTSTGRRVLATRYAREKVEDLELARASGDDARGVDAAIEALGLRHRIATRLTSWIAVTEEATVDPGAATRHERMPHALPHGVSAEGVGLRAAAVAAPSSADARYPGLGRAMAPIMAPPPAPAGPMRSRAQKEEKRSEAPKGMRKLADEAMPTSEEESVVFDLRAAPEPERERAERKPAPMLRVKARKTVLPDGRVVLTFELPSDLRWDPLAAVVIDAQGRRFPVTPVAGTTHAGALSAGATVRLVLDGHGPQGPTIEVGGLLLEVG